MLVGGTVGVTGAGRPPGGGDRPRCAPYALLLPYSATLSPLLSHRAGEFIEHARVHANIYGTSAAAVRAVAAAGKCCLLDIDVQASARIPPRRVLSHTRTSHSSSHRRVQGAELVKKSDLNARFVFVAPPSYDELEKRLRGRGTETEEKLQVRLKNARGEMEYMEVT